MGCCKFAGPPTWAGSALPAHFVSVRPTPTVPQQQWEFPAGGGHRSPPAGSTVPPPLDHSGQLLGDPVPRQEVLAAGRAWVAARLGASHFASCRDLTLLEILDLQLLAFY
ncbi:unnamed protein product [Urochloa humidicola]